MSSISAGLSTGTSLVSSGDTTGQLVLKTNGSTTALTLGTDQSASFAGNIDVSGITDFNDNIVKNPTLKDYALEGVAVGNTGSSYTFDLTNGNFFSATLDQNSTFTFSNPAASGDFCGFVLQITNGGAYLITWPASVYWASGVPPTLTISGLDQLLFTTNTGGSTWLGFVCGLDMKSP